MAHTWFDSRQSYEASPDSGTTPNLVYHLDKENTLIAVETVAMLGGDVTLRSSPKRDRSSQPGPVQPEVVASLERSLRENADVWAELSRY